MLNFAGLKYLYFKSLFHLPVSLFSGIERSLKDLQRQRTSLKSHNKKLKDEVDKAYKTMQDTFEKLHKE